MIININYIKNNFTQFKNSKISTINEGSENWVFEIEEAFILKIPKSYQYKIKIEKEISFIDAANEHIKSLLPKSSQRIQHGTTAYVYDKMKGRRIVGKKLPQIKRAKIGKQIGAYLSELHHLKNKKQFRHLLEVERLDIPQFITVTIQNKDLICEGLKKKDKEKFISFYDMDLHQLLKRDNQQLRICHNDLKGEHLFLNEALDQVIGIIDWADISITEVYKDFAGIQIWQGEKMLKEIIKNYPENGILKAKEFKSAKYFSIHNSIINLSKTIQKIWNAPQALIKQQFENATGIRYFG